MKEKKKNIGIFFSILLMLLCLNQAALSEDNIVLDLQYSEGDLKFAKVGEYDLITLKLDRASLCGAYGEPWLPTCHVHVLLPQDQEVDSIQASVKKESPLSKTYYICPAQPDYSYSDKNPEFINPDPESYASDKSRPEEIAVYISPGDMRGYNIATFQIFPLTYVPKSQEAALRQEIEVTIYLKTKTRQSGLPVTTEDPMFKELVKDQVINPQAAENYFGAGGQQKNDSRDNIKYLIICSPEMAASQVFEGFMDWKFRKGIPIELVDTQWIWDNYYVSEYDDLQLCIKACIWDYIINYMVTWVMIVGDDPQTIRLCYAQYDSPEKQPMTTWTPADLYFAELSSDWDSNHNYVYGEIADNIDLWPDVILGRLPVRTPTEAWHYLDKYFFYEMDHPATGFATKMLLSGVDLYLYNDSYLKSLNMYDNYIAPYWSHSPYWFFQYFTSHPQGPYYNVNIANMNEQLGLGYNFLHMECHGSPDTLGWCMEEGNDYTGSVVMQQLTNYRKYVNALSVSCFVNAFDNPNIDPCLGEGFIRKMEGGGVSFIGNARQGWTNGICAEEHGCSEKFDREFYHHLFNQNWRGASSQVGVVYTQMKKYWIGECYTYSTPMRWCLFTLNLLGDPEMPFYTEDPGLLNPVFQNPIFTGAQTFEVETGLSGAKVCLWKGEEVYTYGIADASGHFEAEIEPATPGVMLITCTRGNYYPYEAEIQVKIATDECENAKSLLSGSDEIYASYLGYATQSENPWPQCSQQKPDAVDIWYKIHPGLEKLVALFMTGDELDSGFIVYSGNCGNLELVDCAGLGGNYQASFQFVTDDSLEQDYYIRLYGHSSMNGCLSVDWVAAPKGKFCINPQPAQCGDMYYYDNRIPGQGSDHVECMHSYPQGVAGQWLELSVPPEGTATISVWDYDLQQYVGIGFYHVCGDVAHPVNSICDWEYTELTYVNEGHSWRTIKVLVNFCVSSTQPEITITCTY